VRLVVREASTMSGVRRVSALIAETNVASRRVAESAGLAPAADDAGTCPDGATQVRAVRHVLDL
jgi:RimJ/RimL family protein N-acetyltransferase